SAVAVALFTERIFPKSSLRVLTPPPVIATLSRVAAWSLLTLAFGPMLIAIPRIDESRALGITAGTLDGDGHYSQLLCACFSDFLSRMTHVTRHDSFSI